MQNKQFKISIIKKKKSKKAKVITRIRISQILEFKIISNKKRHLQLI